MNYEIEHLDRGSDNGTMPKNVARLASHVVGHKIVKVEKNVPIPGRDSYYGSYNKGTALTLDNGKKVFLSDDSDCCAYTELKSFLLHPDMVDHVITGIGTTGKFTTWHIFADMGDVLELKVQWSCGNPFYYGYGFTITVFEPEEWENEWVKLVEG